MYQGRPYSQEQLEKDIKKTAEYFTPAPEPPKPQPLFVTEDGKEIFEGDKFWFVWHKNPAIGHIVLRSYESHGEKCREGETYAFESAKYFSTKEAADEYVRQNKPHFSFDEIRKIVRSLNDGTKGYDAKNFLIFEFNQLANSKNRNH